MLKKTQVGNERYLAHMIGTVTGYLSDCDGRVDDGAVVYWLEGLKWKPGDMAYESSVLMWVGLVQL